MKKINRYFKCPKTGKKPGQECLTCSHRTTRGPETGEGRYFAPNTPFRKKDGGSH